MLLFVKVVADEDLKEIENDLSNDGGDMPENNVCKCWIANDFIIIIYSWVYKYFT